MPKNRHFKSLGKDRNSSQVIQHSSSNRRQQLQQSPQIKSILKNVNLNEYMSAVSDVFRQRLVEKSRDNEGHVRSQSPTPLALMSSSSEVATNSKMQVLKRKHVKFCDVVQAFSIGDGWKMSTFVEKLKSEVDQQVCP